MQIDFKSKEARTERVGLRLLKEEKESIWKAAAAHNTAPSEFIRAVVLAYIRDDSKKDREVNA